MESLDLLTKTVSAERQRQLAHFEALDAKAGVVLGFSGALIALATGRGWFAVVAAGLLAAASLAALTSFWPRSLPAVNVVELRAYLRAEPDFTKLTLHDTYLDMVSRASVTLEAKVRWLKVAMALMAAGGVTLALGSIVRGVHG